MNRRSIILAVPWAASAALSLILIVVGRGGWRGEDNPCRETGACYCERWRPGPIRQPANTWSCLAFVLVGGLVARHAAKGGAGRGRMAARALYPALFATATMLIGPASMALHASMTDWGGKVDGSSMDLYAGFGLAFSISRRFRWGDAPFLAVMVVATASAIGLKFVPGLIRGEVVFGLLVAAMALSELLPEGATRISDRRWLAAAAALFFAAFVVWFLSLTESSPLCRPESLLQGHALWHILSAAAAGTLYLHFLREPEIPTLRMPEPA